ncbi:uncharacterized protein LOC110105533 [Dendrobium catenatum]|uniref:uncharacterized protein LOC110105533 n=1 Tax=Dendrobium catenatum TaxID=906689 RepID=UPI0010A029A4|nr:uncharacterized protein LOC110105533 [Dendrobium catenatum]
MAPIPSRMTSTSDDGERVCPLCAEEMDLTDQQLKPCKCGYEICVWCWHHIMEMAEKEKTEGRCPACRTPYDKERIVGMAVNCERLVAEANGGKRQRSQKGKTKVSAEARKHLSTVRVVQRNLVYIIGLPADLCDESLLERKEYFGQYGEILKVSISRPASTTNQQASNNNVYITYAREEDAVRCIQAVHNYLLDGKRLRACFGTTKYCHAWLRNMICSNPDCLYLHDIGNQEDSFTKDEVVSAYTRSVVLQVPSSNLQRRAGSLLPPAEDWCNLQTVSDKHSVNNASKTTEAQATVSNVSAGWLAILPAASSWGSRASNGLTPSTSTVCSQSSEKQKVETKSHSSTHSSISIGAEDVSPSWHDNEVTVSIAEEGHSNPLPSEPSKFQPGKVSPTTASDLTFVSLHSDANGFGDSAWDDDPVIASKLVEETPSSSSAIILEKWSTVDSECQISGVGLQTTSASGKTSCSSSQVCLAGPTSPVSQDKDGIFSASRKKIDAVNLMGEESLNKQSCSSSARPTDVNQHAHTSCLGSSAPYMDKKSKPNPVHNHENNAFVGSTMLRSQLSTKGKNGSEDLGNLISVPSFEVTVSSNAVSTSSSNLELPMMGFESTGDGDKDISPAIIGIKQLGSADTIQISRSPHFTHSLSNCKHQPCSSLNDLDANTNSSSGESIMPINAVFNQTSSNEGNKVDLSNMYKPEISLDSVVVSSNRGFRFLDSFNDSSRSEKDTTVNTKESNIITDILSLDFDQWNESMSPADDLSRMLSDNGGQNSSVALSRSWISQNINQSRFSFARQEDPVKSVEPSISDTEHMKRGIMLKGSRANGFQNGSTGDDSYGYCATQSLDRPAGVSRIKMLAPPGFSVPSGAPPPGFSDQDRYEHNLMATVPENHLHGNSLFRNQYEVHPTENSVDLEFIDPAIMAVGKGHMPLGTSINNGLGSAFPERFRSEGDLIDQLLMKRSISYQNMRISDPVRENFLPLNDSYAMSYHFPQNYSSLSPLVQLSLQQPRTSPISNTHWDGWSNKQSGLNIDFTFQVQEMYTTEHLACNCCLMSFIIIFFISIPTMDLTTRSLLN